MTKALKQELLLRLKQGCPVLFKHLGQSLSSLHQVIDVASSIRSGRTQQRSITSLQTTKTKPLVVSQELVEVFGAKRVKEAIAKFVEAGFTVYLYQKERGKVEFEYVGFYWLKYGKPEMALQKKSLFYDPQKDDLEFTRILNCARDDFVVLDSSTFLQAESLFLPSVSEPKTFEAKSIYQKALADISLARELLSPETSDLCEVRKDYLRAHHLSLFNEALGAVDDKDSLLKRSLMALLTLHSKQTYTAWCLRILELYDACLSADTKKLLKATMTKNTNVEDVLVVSDDDDLSTVLHRFMQSHVSVFWEGVRRYFQPRHRQTKITDLPYMIQQVKPNDIYQAARSGDLEAVNAFIANGVDVTAKNNRGDTALHSAAHAGHELIVEVLIKECPADERTKFITTEDNYRRTALHRASMYEKLSAVKKLIEKCPASKRSDFIRAKDKGGQTALHRAAENSNSLVVETLIKECPADERTKFIKTEDNYGRTALHRAAQYGQLSAVEKLIELCPASELSDFITAKDSNGRTALHRAAENSNSLVVETLIKECPADERTKFITAEDNYGRTALHRAAIYGKLSALKKLIEKCPASKRSDFITARDNDGDTALFDAIISRELSIFEWFIEECPEDVLTNFITAKNNDNETALHRAALYGQLSAVKKLIEKCPASKLSDFIRAKDKGGQTALHRAAENGNSLVVETLIKKCPADERTNFITAKNNDNETALHRAAQYGQLSVVEKLIELCPESKLSDFITAQDNDDLTALYFAAKNGYILAIEKLIEKCPESKLGDVITATGKDGRTALHIAAIQGHELIVEMLIKKCPESVRTNFITTKYGNNRTVLHMASINGKLSVVEKLIELCPESELSDFITAKDSNGRTALHRAALIGDVSIVEKLIEECPESERDNFITAKDNDGRTALHYAAQNGHVSVIKELIEQCPESELSDFITATDKGGRTILHCAAQNGHVSAVKALVEQCPESKLIDFIAAKNREGCTALQKAVQNGSLAIAQYLWGQGPPVVESSPLKILKNILLKKTLSHQRPIRFWVARNTDFVNVDSNCTFNMLSGGESLNGHLFIGPEQFVNVRTAFLTVSDSARAAGYNYLLPITDEHLDELEVVESIVSLGPAELADLKASKEVVYSQFNQNIEITNNWVPLYHLYRTDTFKGFVGELPKGAQIKYSKRYGYLVKVLSPCSLSFVMGTSKLTQIHNTAEVFGELGLTDEVRAILTKQLDRKGVLHSRRCFDAYQELLSVGMDPKYFNIVYINNNHVQLEILLDSVWHAFDFRGAPVKSTHDLLAGEASALWESSELDAPGMSGSQSDRSASDKSPRGFWIAKNSDKPTDVDASDSKGHDMMFGGVLLNSAFGVSEKSVRVRTNFFTAPVSSGRADGHGILSPITGEQWGHLERVVSERLDLKTRAVFEKSTEALYSQFNQDIKVQDEWVALHHLCHGDTFKGFIGEVPEGTQITYSERYGYLVKVLSPCSLSFVMSTAELTLVHSTAKAVNKLDLPDDIKAILARQSDRKGVLHGRRCLDAYQELLSLGIAPERLNIVYINNNYVQLEIQVGSVWYAFDFEGNSSSEIIHDDEVSVDSSERPAKVSDGDDVSSQASSSKTLSAIYAAIGLMGGTPVQPHNSTEVAATMQVEKPHSHSHKEFWVATNDVDTTGFMGVS